MLNFPSFTWHFVFCCNTLLRIDHDSNGNSEIRREFSFLGNMDSVEEEYCSKFVKRVCTLQAEGGGETLHPDVIFCTRNCSLFLKEKFQEENIAVISNLKRACMLRLLRCSNAILIKQRDRLPPPPVIEHPAYNCCNSFAF
jgi:hypothetical protein